MGITRDLLRKIGVIKGIFHTKVKVKVKVTQSCLTLCNPVDYTDHGILQARILEWVAFPFSRGSPNTVTELRSPTFHARMGTIKDRKGKDITEAEEIKER